MKSEIRKKPEFRSPNEGGWTGLVLTFQHGVRFVWEFGRRADRYFKVVQAIKNDEPQMNTLRATHKAWRWVNSSYVKCSVSATFVKTSCKMASLERLRRLERNVNSSR